MSSVTDKKFKNFRLTEEARRLLALLAQEGGISQTAIVETLIRKEARRLKIK